MRVVLDNDSSDSRTVVDVFAHDRPGLLYTVARALYELRLSVDLARISTHYDQVVDVFYVRETNGRKAAGDARLAEIQETLTARLEAFERSEFRTFVA
jgi:[protein-PII] uridylyltransferase